ncbi:MAG TPA: hypothetical protein DEG47_15410, partial [Cyanobacteria bacterium UBA11148]|nr:hypothetical protein [Cyanobacteria bacterium UBA11148]
MPNDPILTTQPLTPSIPPLLGASLDELTQWVKQQGQPAYRGHQLHQWIYKKGARSLSDISVFPKSWRNTLADIPIGRSTLHYRSEAPDGTVKYLLQLADSHIIETVGIPTFDTKKTQKQHITHPLHPL